MAQTLILGDEQHTVARGDTEERYEAYDSRDAHLASGEHNGKDAAYESQGQVEQDHSGFHRIAELHEKEAEDDHDGQDTREVKHPTGALLALKLATILHVVAFRQLHFVGHNLLDVGHNVAQRPATGVGRDNDLALHVLTVDGVGTSARHDIGHVA